MELTDSEKNQASELGNDHPAGPSQAFIAALQLPIIEIHAEVLAGLSTFYGHAHRSNKHVFQMDIAFFGRRHAGDRKIFLASGLEQVLIAA